MAAMWPSALTLSAQASHSLIVVGLVPWKTVVLKFACALHLMHIDIACLPSLPDLT